MINKIVIFIFASCFMIETILANSTEYFSTDKFAGLWYGVGIISTSNNHAITYTCYQINVMKLNDYDNIFHEDVTVKMNGVPKFASGVGSVDNSIIRIYFPHIENAVETFYSVEMHNEGQEIIVLNQNETDPIGVLFSRIPIVLPTTKSEFEKHSPQESDSVIYIDNDNCLW